MQWIALLVMGHPADLKGNENSLFQKIWLLQMLKKKWKPAEVVMWYTNWSEFKCGYNSYGDTILIPLEF